MDTVIDFDDEMGASTCVGCGECVQVCPTGALMPKAVLDEEQKLAVTPDRQIESVCPYCGVGCQLTFNVKDEKMTAARFYGLRQWTLMTYVLTVTPHVCH